MPFVDKEHRIFPDMKIAGDRCFIEFKPMIDAWRKEMRWATCDNILSEIIPDDVLRAKILAFLVFFNMHVIPYEEQKKKENGEI